MTIFGLILMKSVFEIANNRTRLGEVADFETQMLNLKIKEHEKRKE